MDENILLKYFDYCKDDKECSAGYKKLFEEFDKHKKYISRYAVLKLYFHGYRNADFKEFIEFAKKKNIVPLDFRDGQVKETTVDDLIDVKRRSDKDLDSAKELENMCENEFLAFQTIFVETVIGCYLAIIKNKKLLDDEMFELLKTFLHGHKKIFINRTVLDSSLRVSYIQRSQINKNLVGVICAMTIDKILDKINCFDDLREFVKDHKDLEYEFYHKIFDYFVCLMKEARKYKALDEIKQNVLNALKNEKRLPEKLYPYYEKLAHKLFTKFILDQYDFRHISQFAFIDDKTCFVTNDTYLINCLKTYEKDNYNFLYNKVLTPKNKIILK